MQPVSVPLSKALTHPETLFVRQRKELAEIFGFETRNKYSIESESGEKLGFVAEQSKGVLGFLGRQFFGHWRSFDLHFYDEFQKEAYVATHPFRFFFQRLELRDFNGVSYGAIQTRFAIFTKRFDIEDAHGNAIMTVASPFFSFWTFKIMKQGIHVATIQKKWSGALQEFFTDADNFAILWHDQDLQTFEKALVLAACIYIDLLYFERKGDGGGVSVLTDN